MKKRIIILYGGPSNEHGVSICSAQNVIDSIDRGKFEITLVYISKAGLCNFSGQELKIEQVIPKIKHNYDIVFPVLHGAFGEDGTLQELLEKEKITFVGSGSISSRIAINKDDSNKLFKENGIKIPESQIITKEDSSIKVNFPIILKPINEGSSRGLFKYDKLDDYKDDLNNIFKRQNKVLIQEFIVGREFTCGVIEIEGREVALPVSEIILKSTETFNYQAKYIAGICDEITPANIRKELKDKIQNIAIKCHKILGCKSISRTDVITTPGENIYVLETNTMPGLTKNSFIPAQAKEYGLSMKDLISLLLNAK
jgi:D-alanine-D-alanine ligase